MVHIKLSIVLMHRFSAGCLRKRKVLVGSGENQAQRGKIAEMDVGMDPCRCRSESFRERAPAGDMEMDFFRMFFLMPFVPRGAVVGQCRPCAHQKWAEETSRRQPHWQFNESPSLRRYFTTEGGTAADLRFAPCGPSQGCQLPRGPSERLRSGILRRITLGAYEFLSPATVIYSHCKFGGIFGHRAAFRNWNSAVNRRKFKHF